MGGEDAATGRKYAATEETPPRAWGRQRDFIVFFISFYFYPYFKTAASRPRLPLSPARHNRPPSISRLRCRLMLPLVRRPSSVAARQGHPCYFPAVADFRQGHTFRPLLLMQRWRGREGDPVRPQGGRSAKAGANITPATGRGRSAPTPRATRGGRGTVNPRDTFHAPAKGEYGGAGGVEGEPLSPHAPRRAGDLPPAPGSSRDARKKKKGSVSPPSPASPHAPRRVGDLPPAPGSSRDARKNKTRAFSV